MMEGNAAAIETELRAELGPQLARFGDIEVLDRVDSSNADLLRRGVLQPDRSLLLALDQTAGRGRHGRLWQTPPGGQLAMSLALLSTRPLNDWQGLPLAVGVAVATVLRDLGANTLKLKWPNDLLIGNAKLGGILLESRLPATPASPTLLVIGIGINRQLAQRPQLDQELIALADVLAEATPGLPLLAAQVGCALLDAIDSIAEHGLAPSVAAFETLDALRGQELDIRLADGRQRTGRALGVAADGRLRVLIDGTEQHLLSAEVSVRAR